MPIIQIETFIQSSIQTCFDLSRSIDIHMQSTAHTKEKAVAGVTSGLIGLNETVTWEAIHFGIKLRLTSKITEFDSPHYFVDEMVKGPFQGFRHEHHFIEYETGTKMTDSFQYTSPLGLLGKAADQIFLKAYMEKLLSRRNNYIKDIAEQ
ncbi:SRPBCC family protein [Shimazuella kribbensis]|uniref:SRPBCC family protein n=1 Tax=Shimazuella kribbensis TaxID=139808 RepID=UPI0004265995|nr:SRPBCC family protein [Shimazuella kribbensis]